jgi:glycerol uptake facilitator-like aquaporin
LVAAYAVAQVVGGTAGAVMANLMFDLSAVHWFTITGPAHIVAG